MNHKLLSKLDDTIAKWANMPFSEQFNRDLRTALTETIDSLDHFRDNESSGIIKGYATKLKKETKHLGLIHPWISTSITIQHTPYQLRTSDLYETTGFPIDKLKASKLKKKCVENYQNDIESYSDNDSNSNDPKRKTYSIACFLKALDELINTDISTIANNQIIGLNTTIKSDGADLYSFLVDKNIITPSTLRNFQNAFKGKIVKAPINITNNKKTIFCSLLREICDKHCDNESSFWKKVEKIFTYKGEAQGEVNWRTSNEPTGGKSVLILKTIIEQHL
jgi:hypothetical protein